MPRTYTFSLSIPVVIATAAVCTACQEPSRLVESAPPAAEAPAAMAVSDVDPADVSITRPVAGSDIPVHLVYIETVDGLYTPIGIRKPQGNGPFPMVLFASGNGGGGIACRLHGCGEFTGKIDTHHGARADSGSTAKSLFEATG